MPSIGKLTHEHKMKITYLYEKGWKTSAIKRELEVEKISVSWNAVKKVINNHVQGNFRPHEKVEKDRPAFKALTAKDLNLIHATLRKDCNTSARELWRILRNEGTEVSLSTVRKAIKAAGFTAAKPRYCQLIKEKNKIDRVTFCTGIISENDKFDDTIFSDECTIQLHDNKSVTYHEIGAAAPNHCKPKHPLKIHLWGAISKQGPSNLLVFDGIMDSVFYVEGCLKEGLLPFVNNFFPGGHRFIQDNDPKHRSKISKQFMAENGINWFSAWPSGTGFILFILHLA